MNRQRIIAIDGPAASGKSTVAREVAKRMSNCIYVDSGSLYRGVTWKMIQSGVNTKNPLLVLPVLLKSKWKFEVRDRAVVFSIDGVEPGEALRDKDVREAVSDIAAIPGVRIFVVRNLRKLKKLGSLAMEGRDIGSVVFPKTPYKFYLDANPEERANRRHAELAAKGETEKAQEVLESLQRRDQKDSSRKTAPLKIADGAYVIDTSGHGIEEVTRILMDRIAELEKPRTDKMLNPVWYHITCKFFGICLSVVNRYKIYGLKNIPETGGVIIASNHASYIDPPVVGASSRKKRMTHFMARDTLFRNPLMGAFLRRVGVIPLDRDKGDIKAMKTAIQLLKDGASVALFPEGTRSVDGTLQPPKPGIGFLVAKGHAPVVPVYVHGSYEAWSKHSGGLKFKPVAVVFGKLITREEILGLGEGRAAYSLIGELIMKRIAELKENFEKGLIHE
ncbi:MAG: (d)CMP kinase [Kiritimatiellales bacterium]|nr:(d)CMP kinase [Kiritimatiellales bacterium]